MKKRVTPLLLCAIAFLAFLPASLAVDYYWVGGSGLWSEPSNWATTSGGTTLHTQAPTAADKVFFDGNSFDATGQVVQLDVGDNNCFSMIWTGVTNNPILRFPAATSRLNVYYSLVLNENMSVDFGGMPELATVRMLNTGQAVGEPFVPSISTRGKQLPNLTLAGIGGIYSLTETLNVAGTINITSGNFRSGAPVASVFTVNTDRFIANGATVNLQIDRMIITATSLFRISTVSSITVATRNANTDFIANVTTNKLEITAANVTEFGTLTVNGVDGMVNADGLTFRGNVTLAASNSLTFLGSHVLDQDLILANPGAINQFEAGKVITFGDDSQLLTPDASCDTYFYLRSNKTGSHTAFAKSGSVGTTAERLYLRDIHATAGLFNADFSVDQGNTTGWIISAASNATLYWRSGEGNWSDGSKWATTPTGSGSGCIPIPGDNVVFDNQSFPGSDQTVTVDLPEIYFNNMTWTAGVSGFPNWSVPAGAEVYIGGSLTLAENMDVFSDGTLHFVSTGMGNTITAEDFNMDGHDLGNIIFEGSGDWTLQSRLFASGDITFTNGTFDTGAAPRIEAGNNLTLNGAAVGISFNDANIFSKTFQVLAVDLLAFDPGTSNIYTENFNITPQDMTFWELILQGTEGVLRGTNLTFRDVNLSNSVKSTVYGSHTYTNLLQFDKPGMIVEFEAGTTQTMADLEAPGGDCGNQIFVRTTVPGSQVNFVSTGGPISVSYILLQDNAATPIMAYSATFSQNLGNNSGWDFATGGAAASIRYFYWRGGNGSWNDASKWRYALNPNATPNRTNCIPTPNDDVIFDDDSFTGPGQKIVLDGPAQYCRNMTWQDDVVGEPTMEIQSGSALSIYGTLRLANTNLMTLNFLDNTNGTLFFRAANTSLITYPDGLNINTAGHEIPNVTFQGSGGRWVLGSQLNVSNTVQLLNGSLNTGGSNVEAGQFKVNGPNTVLALGSSDLDITESFEISNINTLDAGTSLIRTNVLTSGPTGLTFHQVHLTNIGVLNPLAFDAVTDTELNGDGLIFHSLQLSGLNKNRVHGSHTFNSLLQLDYNSSLNPPVFTEFILDAGSTQTFANEATIVSNSSTELFSYLQTEASLQTATFTKAGGQTICLEFIRVFDIEITPGGATFGYNTDNAAAPEDLGWTPTTDCNSLLPVECAEFVAAVREDNSVELYWVTAQEVNNRGFELQRSTDGRRFEAIAWIEGAGTTDVPQKYTYLDRRTTGLQEAYYRLKQIDFDGAENYACDLQAVNFRALGNGPLQAYPNPAGEQIWIRWQGARPGTTLIRLFDQSGRLVIDRQWSSLEGTNQRELPIGELPRGVYELQLVGTNGRVESVRVLKQ